MDKEREERQHDGQKGHDQAAQLTMADTASHGKHPSDGQAGDAAARRMAGVQDLGTFDNNNQPGPKMAGHTFHLAPGGSLRFAVHENQIYGIIGLQSDGKSAQTSQKLIQPMKPGVLGSTNVYQFTVTMASDAKAGDTATVTTETPYQARNAAGWAFSFKVVAS
jgi:hypothetical protein